MRFRRLARYHGLKRGRVRQTWNKYNLFNLYRLNKDPKHGTFFQQKWHAKAETRAYHGEHIKERQWEHMFSRRIQSVVNMDPRYMASDDGSSMSKGRGSGREPHKIEPFQAGKGDTSKRTTTPYMQMTYAPQERRLDIAVFRALFASSARQARQMVVHGAVKVNGKKMIYPSYLLNPGDLFQVDVEKVMIATGRAHPPRPKDAEEPAAADTESEKAVAEGEEAAKAADVALFKKLRLAAVQIVQSQKSETPRTNKKAVRTLLRQARSISQAPRLNTPLQETADVVDKLTDALSKLELIAPERKELEGEGAAAASESGAPDPEPTLSRADLAVVRREVRAELENPYDAAKPYQTPWIPRMYMAPFAFIPRYLEVNPKICAAVYLRHPVARKGQGEVPTPFPPHRNQLAFNWYLRRG